METRLFSYDHHKKYLRSFYDAKFDVFLRKEIMFFPTFLGEIFDQYLGQEFC